ncbi:MAG: substrate-binding periplasmic protein [Methyloligellaceae bacterium]
MKATHIILASAFVMNALSVSTSMAEECLTIASDPKSVRVVTVLTPDVKKVFKTAGICTKFVTTPIKRIQKNMIDNTIDGEFFRVKKYISAMKQYVSPIPTPALEGNGVIVTLLSSHFKPNNLKEFGDKKLGIIHGYKWHEIMAKGNKNARRNNKYETLFKQLKAGRVDGIIIEDITLNRFLKAGLIKKTDIYVSKPIIDLSVYILLSKKHEKLIGKLDTAMKSVIADGGFKLH